MKLSLPDVSLYAVTKSNVELTNRALKICTDKCDFIDVGFFVYPDLFDKTKFEDRIKDRLSLKGTHQLWVQWDGYILNASSWDNSFLSYDYIGAKWPWHKDGKNIGNSGFCLRSKKLIEILADLKVEIKDGISEDDYVCRDLRPMLEQVYGIRFAPEEVADKFSFERATPNNPTFGFHGFFNMWRFLNDDDIKFFIDNIDDYAVLKSEYQELMAAYKGLQRYDILNLLNDKLQFVQRKAT